ncbi:MAG: ABC transporter ATP-binding protein [Eubacterium sp. 36_13]|nr:MAG: ABC transporter ATP-binding protein [Eubacterium sp. 36_13]
MKKQSDLSRLLGYAGKRKYFSYASWVLAALSALVALAPFYFIFNIIKEVFETTPDFGNAKNLIFNGWMAVLFAVIGYLLYIAALMCSHMAAFRVATNMRKDVLSHLVKLPLGYVEEVGSGRLRKIINDSTAASETYLAHQLPDKAVAVATPIGLIALLFIFDWKLGILSLIPVVLAFLIMASMTGKKMAQKMKEYQNSLDAMSNEAVEYVRGIPVVKTFGQTVFSFKRFKATIDNYEKWVISYTKDLRIPMMLYTAAINSVFVFLIAAALIFTKNGVTNEFLLNLIFYIIITPVISLTLTKMMYQSENAMIVADALQRVDTILDAEQLPETVNGKKPSDSSVEFRNVSYSYDGEKNAVENISLNIPSGSTVAFVGPSGSGKSTMANLISRFFDVSEGQVLVGGVDVRNIKKEILMDNVSFVFQNSHLIKGTILDNVRMARPQASKEEVMNALEKSQCMDIVKKLPNGVDTVVGTNGVYLSGGEQQRIAIARVMLKNAPVVILDEATAFADPDNEVMVQKAFSELAKDRTVIMIAHRLSTVAGADRIYVLKDGKIEEYGKYNELINNGGMFSKMWNDYRHSVDWKVSKEASL